jgi:transcriptional regulator with XRE-family HTH domain
MTTESRAPSPIDVAVGARIRGLRELRGLSQPDLAKELGVTYQQFRKYETGDNRVSAGRLWEIAKILRTTIVYFYEGIDPVPARGRRGLAEETSEFGAPSDQAHELAAAFDRIQDEEVRAALVTEVKKLAWAARKQR